MQICDVNRGELTDWNKYFINVLQFIGLRNITFTNYFNKSNINQDYVKELESSDINMWSREKVR